MMDRSLAGEVLNVSGCRFSTIRIAQAKEGLVCAAGSHDEPLNTVGVWDTEALKNPDWFVEHKGFALDSSATALEFVRSDRGLLLWAGSSRGTLKLLQASPQPSPEAEDVPPHTKWTLSEEAEVVDFRDKRADQRLHSGAISAIAVNFDSALTAGEDGDIRQVQITPTGGVSTIKWADAADCVALYGIKYASDPSQFCTCGSSGLKMWDLRAPASTKTLGAGSGAYMSLEPVETFLMAGGEEGQICIFDTRIERGPLYVHSSNVLSDGYHSAEVWTIRACGGDGLLFLSCSADGTILSSVPELEKTIRIRPSGWHRYSQAVNDVDAYVIDQGLKTESTLIMGASDSGMLVGEKVTGVAGMMVE